MFKSLVGLRKRSVLPGALAHITGLQRILSSNPAAELGDTHAQHKPHVKHAMMAATPSTTAIVQTSSTMEVQQSATFVAYQQPRIQQLPRSQ